MRKLWCLILSGICMLGVQAQGQYQREAFSFKSEKILNSEGEVSHVKVGAYVGKKLVMEKTYEMVPSLSVEMAEHIGSVSESDINFDGYPDVDIYLGYQGGFANNTRHEGLLWNQRHHTFVEAKGYGEIGEPMLVPEKKYIQTVLSAGPEHRVTTYYRWQDDWLQPYCSNTWAIEDDEYVSFEGLLNYPCYRFDAKLDGRIAVNIVFQRTDDNILAGYIYYPKTKNPAPIMIAGSVAQYGDKLYYHLREYQPDGIITGVILLETPVVCDYFSKIEGSWTNPKTQKEMQMTDLKYSQEMPTWFTKSLLTPEDPGNIGREYSFQQWNPNYQDMMGGHITFRAAGKNKVHFECCNVRHNIAEGRSDDDRPAVLKDNVFEYNDSDCDYGFRATFFPRFVVLKTITDAPSYDCFGAGATFDGVYIKIKQ